MKRVLLVDDDRDDTALFHEALEEIAKDIVFEVEHNGRAALEHLNRNMDAKPDLLFIDVNMPGMSGWQCLEEIKADRRFKDMPVIMYSTSSYQTDAEKALALGAACFFTKPSNFNALKLILKTIADNLGGDIHSAIQELSKAGHNFNCH